MLRFEDLKKTKFEERTMKGFLVACNDDSYTVFEAETGKFWNRKRYLYVYMYIPDVSGKEKLESDYICALQKSLYVLKIIPKRWYEKFKSVVHIN